MIIEASRAKTRRTVERSRRMFCEWDRVLFKQVDIPPEDCYKVVKQGRTYVLEITDPSVT